MRKFEQISSEVTLAIMLGRDSVKIVKADGPWYEVESETISGRRLVAWFTVFNDGVVPEEVLNVVSVHGVGDYEAETSHAHVREWLKDNASAGNIYLQHYILAYDMDDSKVFASFLGRECTE